MKNIPKSLFEKISCQRDSLEYVDYLYESDQIFYFGINGKVYGYVPDIDPKIFETYVKNMTDPVAALAYLVENAVLVDYEKTNFDSLMKSLYVGTKTFLNEQYPNEDLTVEPVYKEAEEKDRPDKSDEDSDDVSDEDSDEEIPDSEKDSFPDEDTEDDLEESDYAKGYSSGYTDGYEDAVEGNESKFPETPEEELSVSDEEDAETTDETAPEEAEEDSVENLEIAESVKESICGEAYEEAEEKLTESLAVYNLKVRYTLDSAEPDVKSIESDLERILDKNQIDYSRVVILEDMLEFGEGYKDEWTATGPFDVYNEDKDGEYLVGSGTFEVFGELTGDEGEMVNITDITISDFQKMFDEAKKSEEETEEDSESTEDSEDDLDASPEETDEDSDEDSEELSEFDQGYKDGYEDGYADGQYLNNEGGDEGVEDEESDDETSDEEEEDTENSKEDAKEKPVKEAFEDDETFDDTNANLIAEVEAIEVFCDTLECTEDEIESSWQDDHGNWHFVIDNNEYEIDQNLDVIPITGE